MSSSKPLISVLVPTRDRPDFLRYCLSSLLPQQADFEVIVSDNFTIRSAQDEFTALGLDGRFRYLRPPRQLAMAENWEFAYQQARGELIVTLIDKTLLFPSALARLTAAAEESDSEIFTWWNDFYAPTDEATGYEIGYYSPQYQVIAPRALDTKECLANRLSFATPIALEGNAYFTAKPCFGAYRKTLAQRIVQKTGQLFHPASPDFTTTIIALALTSTVYDMGRPLLLSILSERSNGMQGAQNAAYAKAAWRQIPLVNLFAPISGLHSSIHNHLAADYVATMRKLSLEYVLTPDILKHFVNAVVEDLNATAWDTQADRFEQWSRLKSFAKSNGIFISGLDSAPGIAFSSQTLVTLTSIAAKLTPNWCNRVDNDAVMRSRQEQRKASLSIYDAMYKKFDNPLKACAFGDEHYGL